MRSIISKFSQCKVVVVGEIMLDNYLMGEVTRISPEAPVPIVRVKNKFKTLGGAGNVVLNLAALGCKTDIFSIRGDDSEGEQVSMILREKGITDHVIIDTSRPTISKTRILAQGQQLIRFDEEEIKELSEDKLSSLLDQFRRNALDADVVIISDYGKGIFNSGISRSIISMCKEKQIPVFVDPKRKVWERYEEATCITPNTVEIEEVTNTIITDENMLVKIANEVRNKYKLEWFLVTRGPKGMCLVDKDGMPFFIKATAREVYDVSGAGDTVIATLAAGVAAGLSLPEAVELSNLAAGIVVGKLGSQPITSKELEIEWHIRDLGIKTHNIKEINELDSARIQIQAWQSLGEKVVFVCGCFDLLHPGHIFLLSEAKRKGDRLVVGLNSDDVVTAIKGLGRPILNQQERAHMFSSLAGVDLIVNVSEENPLSVIKVLNPNLILTGDDNKKFFEVNFIESYGGELQLIPMLSGYSITSILDNIKS